MGFGEPKMPTPEEMAKIQKEGELSGEIQEEERENNKREKEIVAKKLIDIRSTLAEIKDSQCLKHDSAQSSMLDSIRAIGDIIRFLE